MITLRAVSKSYDEGRTWAVRDVDLTVAEGELLVLVGASGGGKTTLLKCINRLVEPSRGTVSVGGEDVSVVDGPTLRRRIGYVFQDIGLFPHMTVAENVSIVPRLLEWTPADVEARVTELLELVGLPVETFGERAPAALSGGQQQRVGLARALAARPRLLLMDEPFGALDPVIRTELRAETLRLHRELGLTTVMVTHDMTEALLMGDRIAVVRDGALVRLATPRELLADPGDDRTRRLVETPMRQAADLDALR